MTIKGAEQYPSAPFIVDEGTVTCYNTNKIIKRSGQQVNTSKLAQKLAVSKRDTVAVEQT